MSRKTLPLAAVGVTALAAVIAASTGCTGGGNNGGPPGGYTSMTYLVYGTAGGPGAFESAGATAEFFSDFPSSDPLDDPGANPYANLAEGDCMAVLTVSTAAAAAATHLDVGDPVTLTQSGGGATFNLTKTGNTYDATIPAATFPFNQLFDFSIVGSAEIGAQTIQQALASADNISVAAPAGFNAGDVSFPAGNLTITYGAVQSEMLLVSFTNLNGDQGQICRMPLGTGGSNDFIVPATALSAAPASGVMLVVTYNHRTSDLNGRTVDFVGRNVRFATYTQL